MSDDITPPRGFTPPVPPMPPVAPRSATGPVGVPAPSAAPSRAAPTTGELWLYGFDVKSAHRGIDPSGQPVARDVPEPHEAASLFPPDIFRPAKVAATPQAPQQFDWESPALPWDEPDAGTRYQVVDESEDQPVDQVADDAAEATPSVERPPRKAFAAFILAILLLGAVLGGAYFAIKKGQTVDPFNPIPSQTPVNDGSILARTVQPGSCFELSKTADADYASIWVVDCTQPHDSEVFYNQTVTTDSYPTVAAWDALETSDCGPAFQTYVGSDMVSSSLKTQYIKPTSAAWDAGNRQLVCFVLDPAGDRQTSVANSHE